MSRIKNISHKEHISLDLICYLQSSSTTGDEIGNQIQTPSNRLVYCAELSLNSSEFYNAGHKGIKSEILLAVDIDEYNSEQNVTFDDTTYNIYRTYPRPDGFMELYCNMKTGVT